MIGIQKVCVLMVIQMVGILIGLLLGFLMGFRVVEALRVARERSSGI